MNILVTTTFLIIFIKIRNANRVRQAMRPEDPQDLSFVLQHDHIPNDFLLKDIAGGKSRHLLFATKDQLAYLTSAKTWYVDGTFYVVGKPFYQLFSVNAYVKSDDNIKQIPLVFAVMSGKKKKDYKKVNKPKHFIIIIKGSHLG